MVRTVISQSSLRKTLALLKTKYDELPEDGSFFAIVTTEYDEKGNVVHDFLECINAAISLGYSYINTIVIPDREIQNNAFVDNVKYIVWVCKDVSKVCFNKDAIREKHIWKDVEWGHRAKNYNPKGKDPGNVWIPTEDDGKAHITEHILLGNMEIIKRLVDMTDSSECYELITEDVHRDGKVVAFANYSGNKATPPCVGRGRAVVFFKSSEDMTEIEQGTVKTIVTSPPYWNLKNYFKEGQIGQESYEKYLSRMNTVWRMCYQKLSSNGSMWVNINIRSQKGKTILIPYDFIRQCKEIGFFYKGIIIWHKSSGIPTGAKNIVDRHEYVLVFSKMENFSVEKNVQESFCDYKNEFISGKAFWNINRKAGSVGKKIIHPAIYPNELVSRIVQMTSEESEIIMDPFLGSGTSMIAALLCGRNFYGYEYNEGFKELINSRISRELSGNYNVEFIYV